MPLSVSVYKNDLSIDQIQTLQVDRSYGCRCGLYPASEMVGISLEVLL